MLVDWFTVAAQALNFIILVFLMRRFLYKPILHAIAERERRIASELADAEERRAEAQRERDAFQRKNEAFDRQRAALLSRATDEAQVEGQRLLEQARQAADSLSRKRQELLRSDAQNLNQALAERAQQEVFAIARKALAELAGASLEERLGEVFTCRLRELEGETRAALAEALKTATDPALVRSAFNLPAEQRAAIQQAINTTASAEIRLRFETAPDLVSGLELTTNGLKVGWSIAEYLTSLEAAVAELLRERERSKATRRRDAGAAPELRPRTVAPGTGRP